MRSVRRGRLPLEAIFLIVGAVASGGCYTGSARDVSSAERMQATRDSSWLVVDDVPFVAQHADGDCGPAALAMVLGHFDLLRNPGTGSEPPGLGSVEQSSTFPDASLSVLREEISAREPASAAGVRAGTLRDVARAKGLEAFVVSGTFEDLFAQLERGRPVLVGVAKPIALGRARAHYEVVVGLNRQARLIRSLDPGRGMRENSLEGFAREWVPTHQVTIVVFPPVRHAVL